MPWTRWNGAIPDRRAGGDNQQSMATITILDRPEGPPGSVFV